MQKTADSCEPSPRKELKCLTLGIFNYADENGIYIPGKWTWEIFSLRNRIGTHPNPIPPPPSPTLNTHSGKSSYGFELVGSMRQLSSS